MKSFRNYIDEGRKRTASEVPADEISLLISNMQNMVAKYRRSNRKAADIYHDIMQKGKFVDWLQDNVEPIWDKFGYPELGSHEWGKFQDEVKRKFLIDNQSKR